MAETNHTPTSQDGGTPATPAAPPAVPTAPAAPTIDYDKLAEVVSGRTAAAENAALKGYFQQQGITGEEAAQAIAAYKAQKAKNTPDPAALQQQAAQANAAALQANMENKALLMASELGVDLKTMPYVMKMADLTGVAAEGKVDDEKLKAAITKVLEDVPQLKNKPADENAGGFKVGAGTGSTGAVSDEDAIWAAFNVKKT